MVYARRNDVIARCVAGEYLLVPIRNNLADMNAIYALKGTGGHIWDVLEGPRSVDDLVAAVVHRFEVSEETARLDVSSFLEDLLGRGLVERRA
jgi:hypothetical protein